ncbi:hypothetical protein [Vagococcus fluvialis]
MKWKNRKILGINLFLSMKTINNKRSFRGIEMRDKPIINKQDPDYQFKYNERADSDYKTIFVEDKDDVIFLNGKWGSGKTSYLNVILDNNIFFRFKKIELKKRIVKIIDLWRVTSNQCTSEIFYRKIFPISGFIVRYLFIFLFLILSGFAAYFSKYSLDSSNKTIMNATSYILFASGFLSGLNQIIGKIDYDSLYLKLLKFRTKKWLIWRRRVIIVDDFDRIEALRQEELYKIFNLIENKRIKFIFLGDFPIIENNKNSYLQKIIDKRIELPYELSPSNFWNDYFDHFIKKIEEERDDLISKTESNNLEKLRSTLIRENRTLRERKLFEKYVNEIVFSDSRYDIVNIDQQLVIIYLYLFYNEAYSILVSQIEKLISPIVSSSIFWKYNETNEEKENYLLGLETDIKETFQVVEKGNNAMDLILEVLFPYKLIIQSPYLVNYKYDYFINEYPNYFINFIPTNIEGKEIRAMFKEEIKRDIVIDKLENDTNSDIFNYIRRNQYELTDIEKDNIFKLAMEFIINQDYKYPNDEFILGQKTRKEINMIISMGFNITTHFDRYDSEKSRSYLYQNYLNNLDVTVRLQIYKYFLDIPLTNVLKTDIKELDLIIKQENFNELVYPEYIFHYLYQNNNRLTDNQVDQLITLNDVQFFHFISWYSYQDGVNKIWLGQDAPNDQIKKMEQRYLKLDEGYKGILNLKLEFN